MANLIQPLAKQAFLSQSPSIDMDTHVIKWALVSSGYAYLANHQYVSDLGATVVVRSSALTSKTVTNGVFNCATTTMLAVAGPNTCTIWLFDDTPSTDATKPLIAYYDTGTNMPIVIPSGGADVQITPDTGTYKVFAL